MNTGGQKRGQEKLITIIHVIAINMTLNYCAYAQLSLCPFRRSSYCQERRFEAPTKWRFVAAERGMHFTFNAKIGQVYGVVLSPSERAE
jgi:hypothetical protein